MTLTLDATSDGATQLVPERHLDFGKTRALAPAIYGSVPVTHKISAVALLRRLGDEIRKHRHPISDAITRAVLALFIVYRQPGKDPLEQFDRMLGLTVELDVIDTIVAAFPPHPDLRPFAIGRFVVGPLEREKMRYRCTKVGCDFFQRYPDAFPHQLAIESSVQRTHGVDVRQLRPASTMTGEVTDYYFESLTSLRRETFLRQFREAHIVHAAAGAPDLDLNNVLAWNGSTFISLFQGFPGTKVGYFCPLGTGAIIDFAQIDSRLPAMQNDLRVKYGFDMLSDSEIHSNLRVFCEFLVQGPSHRAKDELGDGLLKYVIALELLFGEKSRSSESVSTRVGVVKALSTNSPFEESVKEVSATYDKRSRYVHAGKQPTADDVAKAEALCQIVLHALLRIQSRPAAHKPGITQDWWRHLDFIAAALRAGKPVSTADIAIAGLATGDGDSPRH